MKDSICTGFVPNLAQKITFVKYNIVLGSIFSIQILYFSNSMAFSACIGDAFKQSGTIRDYMKDFTNLVLEILNMSNEDSYFIEYNI